MRWRQLDHGASWLNSQKCSVHWTDDAMLQAARTASPMAKRLIDVQRPADAQFKKSWGRLLDSQHYLEPHFCFIFHKSVLILQLL